MTHILVLPLDVTACMQLLYSSARMTHSSVFSLSHKSLHQSHIWSLHQWAKLYDLHRLLSCLRFQCP